MYAAMRKKQPPGGWIWIGCLVSSALNEAKYFRKDVLREISKAHRRSVALPLDEYRTHYPARDEAMAQAYLAGAYTMAEIGQHFGVHYMTVSRAVRKHEANRKEMLEC